MNMHISNATDQVHELAPPTCVLLLSKNFDPSPIFNVAPSLSMSNFYFSPMHLHIFAPTSPPLSSISIKGVLLIDTKNCIGLDGWYLNLAFFMDTSKYWNDTTSSPWDTSCRIFDFDTNRWGTSPYVISWVIHLINLRSCMWRNFLHWWSLKVEDHLWNHHLMC